MKFFSGLFLSFKFCYWFLCYILWCHWTKPLCSYFGSEEQTASWAFHSFFYAKQRTKSSGKYCSTVCHYETIREEGQKDQHLMCFLIQYSTEIRLRYSVFTWGVLLKWVKEHNHTEHLLMKDTWDLLYYNKVFPAEG